MATRAEWIEGMRPRTLLLSVSPVVAGSAIALAGGAFHAGIAVLALVVGVSMQIGVNLANDYSDGIRGTDAHRVGPQRLVASGAAAPRIVKRAAFSCFGVGGVAGFGIAALSGQWWLLAVGVAIVLGAWYYTGGKHPYGYLGLGDVFVFVFFGLVATIGTSFPQTGHVDAAALAAACGQGFGACAVLMANNLRDIPTDAAAGKRTLAVRLGDRGARRVFAAYGAAVVVCAVVVAALTTWWALLGLALLPLLGRATRFVLGGGVGPGLIGVLKQVGIAQFVGALGLLAGCLIARL